MVRRVHPLAAPIRIFLNLHHDDHYDLKARRQYKGKLLRIIRVCKKSCTPYTSRIFATKTLRHEDLNI